MLIGAFFILGLLPYIGSWVAPVGLNLFIALVGFISVFNGLSKYPASTNNRNLRWALITLGASFSLSTYYSNFPWESLESLRVLLPGIVLAVVIGSNSNSEQVLHSIALSFFFALLTLTATCLFTIFSYTPALSDAAFGGLDVAFLKVPNDILCFVIFWPIVAWSIISNDGFSQNKKHLAGYSYLALLLTLSVLVGSRSTFFLAVCCSVLWMRHRSPNRFKWVLLGSSGAFVIFLFLNVTFVDRLMELPTSNQRIWIWLVSIKMLHPTDYLLGLGHGMFANAFETARSSVNVPAGLLSDPRRMGWAHNLFVETWVERGFFGLAALLWVFWALAIHVKTVWLGSPYQRAILGFLTLIMITSSFELTLMRPWVCAAFGVAIGAVVGVTQDGKSEAGGTRNSEDS
jgi:hypothetical protein